MAEYCDVLKSHTPDDTLALEVIRFATGETLAGQLNGDALATSFSFSSELTGDAGQAVAPGEAYQEYMAITDDFGAIQVEVPAAWSDVDGRAWADGGEVIGASIYAAANMDDFLNTWSQPGVMFNASDDLAQLGGYVQLLDFKRESFVEQCKLDNRYDYQDSAYRGKFDYFTNCGGPGGADYLVLSAVPIADPEAYLILVEIQIVSEADLEAADRILATFQVIGSLP